MGFFLNIYLSNFITRFDKNGITPFLSHLDFEGLYCENSFFTNSKGNKIAYFFYQYNNASKDKVILFLHGIGPGHTAYMSEINTLCKRGYKVLTLDYTGCDKSDGKDLYSVNQPTEDVDELLKFLNLKEEIIVIGHSLGGYTTLNTINVHENITKAVVISGFISLKKELDGLFKHIPFSSYPAIRYEKKLKMKYGNLDNVKYLKTTEDKILFIHSKDDHLVPFETATGFIQKKIKNKNLSFIVVDGKKHNPNYTKESLDYMTETFEVYHEKIKSKELDTLEKKKEYMSDKSAFKMTYQDEEIWNQIFDFLKD